MDVQQLICNYLQPYHLLLFQGKQHGTELLIHELYENSLCGLTGEYVIITTTTSIAVVANNSSNA